MRARFALLASSLPKVCPSVSLCDASLYIVAMYILRRRSLFYVHVHKEDVYAYMLCILCMHTYVQEKERETSLG